MKADTADVLTHPSPNFGPRRDGALPDMVVLHYTAMTSAEQALERLSDPNYEVSAHYLIAADGRVWQMVEEALRAWHAGDSMWGGVDDVNSRSIGIELDNNGAHPFSEPQMAALERLLPQIMARWQITPERVVAHADIAPDRKIDPGPKFDWHRLARQGLSIWPDPVAASAEHTFDALTETVGYPVEASQVDRLKAFRDRFRPGASGDVCAQDLAVLAALAQTWPASPGGNA